LSFHEDNNRAKPFEHLIVNLLHSWGISAGLNPSTEYQGMSAYDVWMMLDGRPLYLECKLDSASKKTGNVCLELRALRHSKSPLFVYGLPYADKKLYIHVFHPLELESLIRATKLTHTGRFYAYRHVPAGDYGDECVLVPRQVLKSVGRPFQTALKELTKAIA